MDHAAPRRRVPLGMLLVLLMPTVPALGQRGANRTDPADILRDKWNNTCKRIQMGAPWDEVAEEVQAALADAGATRYTDQITESLEAIRAAARQQDAFPDDPSEATPAELVAQLCESHLLEVRNGAQLITEPLAFDAGSGALLWEQQALPPVHDLTDPAVRVFKRGRDMVPALLDGLTDMTATRCVFLWQSANRPVVMLRRADLSLALLEAITQCQFHTRRATRWFMQEEDEVRQRVAGVARWWWKETSDLSPLEARSWLIQHGELGQAVTMIDLLSLQGHTDRALGHLRSILMNPDGSCREAIAERMAVLGDPAGVRALADQVDAGGEGSQEGLRILLQYGGRHEYELLRRLFLQDIREHPDPPGNVSRIILGSVAKSENPLAIAVLAEALQPIEGGPEDSDEPGSSGDDVTQPDNAAPGHDSPSPGQVMYNARAEMAADHIQRLTGRDFGYDARAAPALRQEAIQRIADWWEAEGRGLYGFGAVRTRRTRGIR